MGIFGSFKKNSSSLNVLNLLLQGRYEYLLEYLNKALELGWDFDKHCEIKEACDKNRK